MTYNKSPIVEKNVFLNMPAETAALPKYEEISHLLPMPIWRGHDEAIACHDFAWRTASVISSVQTATPILYPTL